MQVGDKKQATMLSVVAVGAIGFVVFQLVPKAEAKATGKAANATPTPTGPSAPDPTAGAAPATPTGPSVSMQVLQRDPFAVGPKPKPKMSISSKAPDPNASKAETTAPANPSPSVPSPMARFSLPPADPIAFDPIAVPMRTPKPRPSSKPTDAGKSEPPAPKAVETPIPPEPKTVRLLGVVQSSKPIALLQIGDRERTGRLGDELVPGVRITAIGLNGIVFRKTPGALVAAGTPASGQIAPGEEIKL